MTSQGYDLWSAGSTVYVVLTTYSHRYNPRLCSWSAEGSYHEHLSMPRLLPGGQKSLYLHSLSCGSQIQQRDWRLNGPRKQCGNLATGRQSSVRANVAFASTVHKGSHFFHWGQSFDMFYTGTFLKQNENAYPLLSISKQSRCSEIILKCDLILNIYWYSKFSIIQSCKGKIYFSLCRCTTAMVKS